MPASTPSGDLPGTAPDPTVPPPGEPATALLLRPDCYIAWASASPDPDARERQALREALSRWFGSDGRGPEA